METAVRAKFNQNPPLQALLLATGEAELVEDSAHDPFWGIGRDGRGANWLGRLLMKVRQEMRAASHDSSAADVIHRADPGAATDRPRAWPHAFPAVPFPGG